MKLIIWIFSIFVIVLQLGIYPVFAHEGEEHEQISQTNQDQAANSEAANQTVTETTAADQSTIAPETELTATDFDLPEPSTWQFFKRRVVYIFTFDQVKKTDRGLELANLTLLAAKKQAAAGDITKSEQLMDKFNQSMEQLSAQVSTLATSALDADQQIKVQELLTNIQQDRLLQAGVAEQLGANSSLSQKTLKIKNDALKDLTKLLKVDNPDAEKFNERLQKITNKLFEKEAKLEKKFAKKFALIEEIDEDLDDPELENELEKIENEEIEEIAGHDPEKIGEIAREVEGSIKKHLVILEAILAKAPEQAKPALEKVIDNGLEKLKSQLANNPNLDLDESLPKEERQLGSKEKILEKIEKKLGKQQEKVLEKIKEQQTKTHQMKEERQKTLEQIKLEAKIDDDEDGDEDEDGIDDENEDDDEDGDEDEDETLTPPAQSAPKTLPTNSQTQTKQPTNNTTAPTASSPTSVPASPTPTSSTGSSEATGAEEVKMETKTIDLEEFAFKNTKLEVKKGTRLTINFRNKDNLVHDLSIVGLTNTTGPVKPDQEKNLTITVEKDLEFFCSIHPSIPHGKIVVKD